MAWGAIWEGPNGGLWRIIYKPLNAIARAWCRNTAKKLGLPPPGQGAGKGKAHKRAIVAKLGKCKDQAGKAQTPRPKAKAKIGKDKGRPRANATKVCKTS